ncbi:lysylphosphatidylglycerol synthase transmembrane domain-containing protein [Planctomycetota bacterium]
MNKRRIVAIAKIGIACLLVYWLIRSGKLDLAAYKELRSGERLPFIVLMVALQACSLTIVLGRWRLMLRTHRISLSAWACIRLGFRGMFATLFMPGSLGLDGTRALYLRNYHRSQLAEGLTSMIIDRVVGFLGLLLLALIFSFHLALTKGGSIPWMLVGTIAVALIGFAGTVVVANCGWLPRHRLLEGPSVSRWVSAFQSHRGDVGALAIATVLSMLGHLLTSLAACAGLMVLGQTFSWVAVATVTPLVIVARFLPVTPMGLGLSDGVAEYFYDMSGISGGAEVQMLLRATMVFILVSGGISYWLPVGSSECQKNSQVS